LAFFSSSPERTDRRRRAASAEVGICSPVRWTSAAHHTSSLSWQGVPQLMRVGVGRCNVSPQPPVTGPAVATLVQRFGPVVQPGPARGPVKAEIAGSNPVGTATPFPPSPMRGGTPDRRLNGFRGNPSHRTRAEPGTLQWPYRRAVRGSGSSRACLVEVGAAIGVALSLLHAMASDTSEFGLRRGSELYPREPAGGKITTTAMTGRRAVEPPAPAGVP
jgi:hypothetical protein